VVAKIKAAGGIILAKASLSEFAKGGGDNINSVLPGFARNRALLRVGGGLHLHLKQRFEGAIDPGKSQV
jgi:Asp-tRNA(Asn)/Glu-tRNA(Gln) amidotransferase A subunit family amidase